MAGEITRGVVAGLQIRQARENAARVEAIQQRQQNLQEFSTLAQMIQTTNPGLRKVLVGDFLTQFGGDTKNERTKNLLEAIGKADEQQLGTLGSLISQAGLQGITPKQLASSGITASALFKLVAAKTKADLEEEQRRTRPSTTIRDIPTPSGETSTQAITTTPRGDIPRRTELGRGFRVQAQPTTIPRTRADELQGNLGLINTQTQMLDELIKQVETNPTAFGIVGTARGIGQATVDILGDVASAVTPGFIQTTLDQARQGVESGLADQEVADAIFDPTLPESESVANALAYGLALRRKNFKRINKEDLNIAREEFRLRGVRGTKTVLARLRALRRELVSGAQGLERRLGVQQRRDNGGLSQEEQEELERLRREQSGG